MYLLIGADLVPTKNNVDFFCSGNTESLVGDELNRVLSDASYRIFNLEVPLVDIENPIAKQGPNLIAPTGSVVGYKALGTNLLTLANNHILDQGIQGLESTISTLKKAGIAYVGAGSNLFDASTPYVFSFADKRIGVYACAEHEFSIATDNSPGANPFDPLWSLDHVAKLKEQADYIIVLYHGGKEHYRYPSPNLQKTCRRLIEKGANLVVCQHSHCIGCKEQHENGIIVYGQGNFIFDENSNECWKTSLIIKIDEEFNISFLPLVKEGYRVKAANESQGREILESFELRSKEILSPVFVQKKYDEFSNSFLSYYLSRIKGREALLFKAVNKLSNNRLRKITNDIKYDDEHLIALWNWIDCEAHRELLLRGIQIKLKNHTAK